MTFIKGIPEAPSVIEAAFIANILDEAGLYDDANLMDEFVKQASNYKDDLVKQAGLWSGIWNRLGGLTKRLFFKEYRQLYNKAKEAHKLIVERFEEAEKQFKVAKKQIKNYDLIGWRETVLKLPVYTKDLMADYETAFGRLIAFTFKLQKKDNIPAGEFDISNITPPGEGGEGLKPDEKVGEPPKGAPEAGKPGTPSVAIPKGWHRITPEITSVITNGKDIAISRANYDEFVGKHIHQTADNSVKLIEHKKQYPAQLKETLGKDTWKIITPSELGPGWVQLQRVVPGTKQVTPEEAVPDEGFTAPQQLSLPFGVVEKAPGGGLVRSEPKDKIGVEEVKKLVEEEKKHPIFTADEVKAVEAIKNKESKTHKWVQYVRGKESGWFKLVPIKEEVKAGVVEVQDDSLEQKLWEVLFLRRKKHPRGKTVPKKEVTGKAKLINEFLFKIGK